MAQVPPLLTETGSQVPLTLTYDEDDPGFLVESGTASLALSQNFSVTLLVRHPNAGLDTRTLIGRRARVSLDAEENRPAFSGMVRSVRFVNTVDSFARYEILLRPRTEWLTFRRDHRVFKDMNAMELAVEIAKPLTNRIGEILAVGGDSLPTHEYRAQYGESDFLALQRILADDGVSFTFDLWHDSRLVLFEDTTLYSLTERTLPFAPGSRLQVSGSPAVTAIHSRAQEFTRQVEVQDLWVDRPDYEATAYMTIEVDDHPLEDYNFDPGINDTDDELIRQALIRMHGHLWTDNIFEVTTNAFFAPGSTLVMPNSPLVDPGWKLLVIATACRWSNDPGTPAASYTLECIPQARRWVPPRPPKPTIPGIQKAFVVGEGEIDTDALGRVLCSFRWDRGKKVSRRVEVSQAWAGPGYGLFAQPRVGDQVLVAYLDGDPDEPVVVGRVHNGKNLPPLALPADKEVSVWRTRSTPGGSGYNEILMDDKAGKERVAIHAQLDFRAIVERDADWFVKRDYTVTVEGDHRQGIVGQFDTAVSGNTTFMGPSFTSTTRELTMTSTTMTFTADTRSDRIFGSYQVDAGNESHTVRDKWSVSGPEFEVDASHVKISAGGACIEMTGVSIDLTVGGSRISMMDGFIEIVSALIDLNP